MAKHSILFVLTHSEKDSWEGPLSTKTLESVVGGESRWPSLGSPAVNKSRVLFYSRGSYFPASLISINVKHVLKFEQVLDFSRQTRQFPQIITSHLILYILKYVL